MSGKLSEQVRELEEKYEFEKASLRRAEWSLIDIGYDRALLRRAEWSLIDVRMENAALERRLSETLDKLAIAREELAMRPVVRVPEPPPILQFMNFEARPMPQTHSHQGDPVFYEYSVCPHCHPEDLCQTCVFEQTCGLNARSMELTAKCEYRVEVNHEA